MNDGMDGAKEDQHTKSYRRKVLSWVGGIGVVSFGMAVLTTLKDTIGARNLGETVGDRSDTLPEDLGGQRLVHAWAVTRDETPENAIVTVEDFTTPDAALVYPEDFVGNSAGQILLHKLNTERVNPPTDIDLTHNGFVAYSAVCTHLQCDLQFRDEDYRGLPGFDWCPCHQGRFNPYKGGRVIEGPPSQPVPQIGVEINASEEFVLTSGFQSRGDDENQ